MDKYQVAECLKSKGFDVYVVPSANMVEVKLNRDLTTYEVFLALDMKVEQTKMTRLSGSVIVKFE